MVTIEDGLFELQISRPRETVVAAKGFEDQRVTVRRRGPSSEAPYDVGVVVAIGSRAYERVYRAWPPPIVAVVEGEVYELGQLVLLEAAPGEDLVELWFAQR